MNENKSEEESFDILEDEQISDFDDHDKNNSDHQDGAGFPRGSNNNNNQTPASSQDINLLTRAIQLSAKSLPGPLNSSLAGVSLVNNGYRWPRFEQQAPAFRLMQIPVKMTGRNAHTEAICLRLIFFAVLFIQCYYLINHRCSQGGSLGARDPPFCKPFLTKQPKTGGENAMTISWPKVLF